MVLYLFHGEVDYTTKYIPLHQHPFWEFFLVCRGRCRVMTEAVPTGLADEERQLWIFPPKYVHGYLGDGSSCESFVCQFETISPVIERVIQLSDLPKVTVSKKDIRTIVSASNRLEKELPHSSPFGMLLAEKLLIELSIIFLKAAPRFKTLESMELCYQKVQSAVSWYSQHVHERPSLKELAKQVNLSESHLRRLFYKVERQSPNTILVQIKLRRAMELMLKTPYKLERIAELCGFKSASSLCRAFKEYFKTTPRKWQSKGAFSEYNKEIYDGVRAFWAKLNQNPLQ